MQQLLKFNNKFCISFQPSQKDSIDITADEEQFQISIENSLNILLTGCEIRIDGTGLIFHNSPILCGLVILQF